MRVLICGSRTWESEIPIRALLELFDDSTVVIHGAARGADSIAGAIAEQLGLAVEAYPAEWQRYGRGAGPIRNQQMLDEGKPDVVFAFSDDIKNSRGTADMVRRSEAAGLPTFILGG